MDTIKTDGEQIGWRFGLRWVLLTIAGLIIGFIAGFVLGEIGLWYIGTETIMAGVVGLMQWLALRRVIKTKISWVMANVIGFLVSSSIHSLAIYVWKLPEDMGVPLGALGWMIAFVLGGTLTGIMQQRILRHHVRNSGWWVPANAAGWGLGMAGMGVVFSIFHTIKNGPFILMFIREVVAPLLGLLVPSVILGIITAATLIWLLRQPTQQMLDTAAQK